MERPRTTPWVPRLLAVVMSFTVSISLISFASTETDEELFDRIARDLPLMQGPTGTLTVIRGDVTVNGNLANTGLTIVSNSTITTSSSGGAVIELGSLGRVQLGNDTTVVLTWLPVMLFVKSKCDRTQVKVTRGQVEIQSPKRELIPAGQTTTYKGSVEAVTNGSTDFVIDCRSRNVLLLPIGGAQGLWGLLALLGETGIQAAEEEIPPPEVSPFQP